MRAKWLVVAAAAAIVAAGCSRQEAGWRDAAREDSVAAYQAYLARFPAGAHAAMARQRIAELRDDRDWALAARLRTPEAWQRYLSGWPEGRHAAEARERLAAYIPQPSAPGAWAVQLGAWSEERAARAASERLRRVHATELGNRTLVLLAPRDAEEGVWRVRTGPLDEAAARGLCARLRERDVDCVPVAD